MSSIEGGHGHAAVKVANWRKARRVTNRLRRRNIFAEQVGEDSTVLYPPAAFALHDARGRLYALMVVRQDPSSEKGWKRV